MGMGFFQKSENTHVEMLCDGVLYSSISSLVKKLGCAHETIRNNLKKCNYTKFEFKGHKIEFVRKVYISKKRNAS